MKYRVWEAWEDEKDAHDMDDGWPDNDYDHMYELIAKTFVKDRVWPYSDPFGCTDVCVRALEGNDKRVYIINVRIDFEPVFIACPRKLHEAEEADK